MQEFDQRKKRPLDNNNSHDRPLNLQGKLFGNGIGNLSKAAITKVFYEFGSVAQVDIPTGKDYCFIWFNYQEDAVRAIKEYRGEIKIKFAEKPMVWVGNIPDTVTNLVLHKAFETMGTVESAIVYTRALDLKSLGYGHVVFASKPEAEQAVKTCKENPMILTADSFCPIRVELMRQVDNVVGFSDKRPRCESSFVPKANGPNTAAHKFAFEWIELRNRRKEEKDKIDKEYEELFKLLDKSQQMPSKAAKIAELESQMAVLAAQKQRIENETDDFEQDDGYCSNRSRQTSKDNRGASFDTPSRLRGSGSGGGSSARGGGGRGGAGLPQSTHASDASLRDRELAIAPSISRPSSASFSASAAVTRPHSHASSYKAAVMSSNVSNAVMPSPASRLQQYGTGGGGGGTRPVSSTSTSASGSQRHNWDAPVASRAPSGRSSATAAGRQSSSSATTTITSSSVSRAGYSGSSRPSTPSSSRPTSAQSSRSQSQPPHTEHHLRPARASSGGSGASSGERRAATALPGQTPLSSRKAPATPSSSSMTLRSPARSSSRRA